MPFSLEYLSNERRVDSTRVRRVSARRGAALRIIGPLSCQPQRKSGRASENSNLSDEDFYAAERNGSNDKLTFSAAVAVLLIAQRR